MKKIAGCFTKIGESKNGVIVGTIGKLTIPTYEEILEIAKFYNINTTPGVFGYHLITKDGAEKYSNLPVSNYNNFIEFLAL